ncbi:MAG: 3-phosphoshikimate 1-carboxyvinyltransferase [Armatimonadetes bacterium]|nr:3-phosphoshikimate 1-carboxyvinyltransferase [Armatimonadota bacterium]
MECHGGKKVVGEIIVPPDKSITHRALILSALAEGDSEIRNPSRGQDCLSTLSCMRALGVQVDEDSPDSPPLEGGAGGEGRYHVQGLGLHGLREPADVLNAGNSGTTMRLLAGVLSGQHFFSVLTGDDSLRSRPMARIVTPLRMMGAQVTGREEGRHPPLAICGAPLKGISYTLPIPSAQVKSAILLAGLFAEGETIIEAPAPSRDHTELMLEWMGCGLNRSDSLTTLVPGVTLSPISINVPGDFSSAAFWIVAALICPGSRVRLPGVGVNPTRTGLLKALSAMGASISVNPLKSEGEPIADLEIASQELQGIAVQPSDVPSMIDEIPVLAVAATQARGVTEIRGAGELRAKESDRLACLAQGLRDMGAELEELPDGLIISGPTPLRSAVCETRGDHRMAMAFSVAALAAGDSTTIRDAECVAISYPGFWETLGAVAKG